MKLSEALSAYLRSLAERGLSRSHQESANGRLTRFLEGRETVRVREVVADDIASHFRGLDASGLARGTLAGYKSSHRAFWHWCLDQNLIDADPSAVLRRKEFSYSYDPVNHQAADEAAFTAVLDALPRFAAHRSYEARDVRDALAVSMAADSAARRGEVWAIRRKDLEKALKRPTALRGGGNVYHIASSGKTGQANVRFFDQTAEFARRWLETLPPTAVFVFSSTKTWERLPRDYMNSAFKRACEFANVPTFQWQSVRKRVVTNIIEQTGNVTAGQLLAGHTSEKTTLKYYNMVAQARVDAAAGQLARRRSGSSGEDLAGAFFANLAGPEL